MPYRELTMIDVKEVLRRWSAGHGDRRIGRETGADRKTVARYTQAAERLGLTRSGEVTDEEVHAALDEMTIDAAYPLGDEWSLERRTHLVELSVGTGRRTAGLRR